MSMNEMKEYVVPFELHNKIIIALQRVNNHNNPDKPETDVNKTIRQIHVTHRDMVAKLFKPMDSKTDMLLHAVMGVGGEAGELTDAVKKHWAYEKELDVENMVEELGDLLFYVQAVCQVLSLSIEQVLAFNIDKLLLGDKARYKAGTYSNEQATARADKVSPVPVPQEWPTAQAPRATPLQQAAIEGAKKAYASVAQPPMPGSDPRIVKENPAWGQPVPVPIDRDDTVIPQAPQPIFGGTVFSEVINKAFAKPLTSEQMNELSEERSFDAYEAYKQTLIAEAFEKFNAQIPIQRDAWMHCPTDNLKRGLTKAVLDGDYASVVNYAIMLSYRETPVRD